MSKQATITPYINWDGRLKVNLAHFFETDQINVNTLLVAVYIDNVAFILFEFDNKLWEVNASHCSCSIFKRSADS